jgi:trk system potassium uptake protein TrkH
LYIGLTVAETLALATLGWLGVDERMTEFEALAHAFTTMPTGGFSTQARSIEVFSATSQWIIILFMILAGTNFALMYRGFARRQPGVVRDEELRLYLAMIAVAAALLTAQLWAYGIAQGEAALRAGVFQTVSIITTTGYASTDFVLWPTLSLLTLLALMFVGGSAGSTGGSIKVVRHLLVGKILRREIDQTISPELVMPIRLNRVSVDERTLAAIVTFVILYVGAWAVGSSVIAIDSAITGVGFAPIDALANCATALWATSVLVLAPQDQWAPSRLLATCRRSR